MNNFVKISGNVRKPKPVFTGDDYFPVIIASTGLTLASDNVDKELKKAKTAISAGADIITDHSLTDNIELIHNLMAESIETPISCIAIYEVAVLAKQNANYISGDKMIKMLECQAKRGMDIVTIHATAFRDDVSLLKENQRLIPCTSRGGTMMLEILQSTREENPYWLFFDDVLDIAQKYSLSLSLGTCYRPASVCDIGDVNDLYFLEMKRMAELIKRAKEKNVGIIVEGIGHAPINRIPDIIMKSKEICLNAPYRVLTVATDIALGYDHISSAIASSTAVYNGANMITCVSRSEHIGLPSESDLLEAVISSRIAAHCGYSARTNDFSKDYIMSKARNAVGCYGQIEASIYPQGAEEAIKRHKFGDEKLCSMCGAFCALAANDRLL